MSYGLSMVSEGGKTAFFRNKLPDRLPNGCGGVYTHVSIYKTIIIIEENMNLRE